MRKGIWIRLLIYIPLLSYFGYYAFQKWSASRQPPPPAGPELEGRKHMFTLPDGKSVEVVEITEEQARAMGLDPGKAGEAAPKAPPAGETKSDAAPAPPAN